ncbi:MAG: 16S rRNA (guanine(527)-N(7))-methyltransferase RsmG [Cyclobacteriaceae bacterium]|nr:16S rRNA (guanine(527)-N(7))-methyltransferase RsmG [Cyclobacteriaceae bacterium HetDA_MAG_MS6]
MLAVDLISKYFPDLSEKQQSQFDLLPRIYQEWNDKINVVSRKDIDELPVRHILHSLAIAKAKPLPEGSTVLDLGTGGGFPGIPLAIFYPSIRFHLVDSVGKKIKVVNEVIDHLSLSNITAEHIRAERVKDTYDFVVTRAVAPARQLFNWTHQRFKKDITAEQGIIALKGGDLTDELSALKRPYQEIAIADIFEEDFFETKKVIFIPM